MQNVFSAQQRSRSPGKFRTRRAHQKSRMGCFECKRRKRKCDELKPSCTRCNSTFQKCRYPAPSSPTTKVEFSDTLSLPSPPCTQSSESPSASVHSEDLTFEALFPTSPLPVESGLQLAEAELLQHYLDHTSHTLTHFPSDQSELRDRIPALALRSNMVSCSMQALSAVCLCCDMIKNDSFPNPDTVRKTLMTGYRLYNQASEQMRDLISRSDKRTSELELLLACAMLLFPFIPASQQVNHWMSSQSNTATLARLLSTSPRDVIVMMRGIRATIEALNSRTMEDNNLSDSELGLDTTMSPHSPYTQTQQQSIAPPPLHAHIMFPIVAATSESAFSSLKSSLDTQMRSIEPTPGPERDQISACATVLCFLDTLRSETFQSSALPTQSPELGNIDSYSSSTLLWPAHAQHSRTTSPTSSPPPLSSKATQGFVTTTEPLTCRFLAFLVEAPQPYLDLVFPLLDQRLEKPHQSLPSQTSTPKFLSASPNTGIHLTPLQSLALDIYAHWSVLMFLVEHESWWIGRLPRVTLEGMVNRFGEGFVDVDMDLGRRREGGGQGQGQWWPGKMLRVLKEVG